MNSQGTGADMAKESMVKIEKYFQENNFRNTHPETGIVLAPYDEIGAWIPTDRKDIQETIIKIMEDTSALYLNGTKIGVDYNVLKTWIK